MPSKMLKVEWSNKNSGGLNEIYQNTGLCFSFLSSPTTGNCQCHQWVKCRDYLQDAVRTTLTGNPTAIYGFRFEKDKNPAVDLKKMRMLVSRYDMKKESDIQTFKRKMRSALVLLHHFEKHAGMALSSLKEVDATGHGKKAVVAFIGSAIWMKSPFLVSMYTYLIRLGDKELEFKNATDLKKKLRHMAECFNKGEKFGGDNDVDYLRTMWPHLHTVLKNRNKLFRKKDGFDETFFQNVNINSFHNNGGILSLIRCNTPNTALNKRVSKMIG